MSNKQLALLVILAIVLAVVTAGLYRARRQADGSFASGASLIQGLESSLIHKLVIQQSGKTVVTLAGRGKAYTVAEKNDYPAAMKAINELLLACLEIRAAEKITDSRDNHEALGIQEDSADAVSISFLDEKGQPLIGLVKGKSTERGSGVYVRLLGKDTVYRSEKRLSLKTDPLDYVTKTLIDVKDADIRQVKVKTEQDTYTVTRDKQGTIALQNIPAGKRAKKSEVEGVFRAVTRLNLSGLTPADKAGLKWDAAFSCVMKSGLTYHVKLAKKDDKHYVALAADGPKVDSLQITQTESEEALKEKETIILAVQKAAKFTPRHASWVYEIPSWIAKKMRKPLAELIADIPADKAPEDNP